MTHASRMIVPAIVMWLAGCNLTVGAEQLNKDDVVEVLYLRQWHPGVVIKGNVKGMVLVEFEFAGRKRQDTFRRTDVRLAYENGAISPPRSWTDSEGKSLGRAVLIEVGDKEITLRKRDMSEFNVSIASLSKADQDFLKQGKKGDAAATSTKAPQPPPIEQFEIAGDLDSRSLFSDSLEQSGGLAPDPLPTYVKLKQGGVGFPAEDFFDELVAVMPVGGPDSWLLAAVENHTPGNPLPTQLIWASTVRQKVERRQLLPAGEIVLDYYPPGHRLLTAATVDASGVATKHPREGTHTLTLWDVLPTDAKAVPVVRWEAPFKSIGSQSMWARLADKNTVIQRRNKQEWVAWDAAAKTMRYRIAQKSFFAPPPTLSGGRKYLFIPEDNQVRVIESVSGRAVLTLPAPQGASAVAVSDDGRNVAVLSRNDLTVWDLAEPKSKPRSYQAEAVGTPFEATLSWCSAERLLVDAGRRQLVLFSLPHQLAIWNYTFDADTNGDSLDQRVKEVVAGYLVYTASLHQGTTKTLAVGAVRLPGPKVDEAVAALDVESLMILKPGSAVKLEVSVGEHAERVRAALEAKIKANGWKLDDNAQYIVRAEMTRGQTQQVTYHFIGKPDQTVSVTPEISQVSIKCGDKTAWQSASGSGAPPMITLREGESAQAEIDKYQKPNVEFFERLNIPKRILDPDKCHGIGSTAVTARGLVAVDEPPVNSRPRPQARGEGGPPMPPGK
jgi:hypothetical protein